MDEYLERSLSVEKIREEIENPDSQFYFLFYENELAGYIKVNEHCAQTELRDDESLELERIYVKESLQGKGLGKFLIQKAVEIASEKDKLYLWLGVWEKNEKAISFYKKHGFEPFGQHDFYLGNERQRDLLMRMRVS
ncbi:MAG TPA: GNAT family N-acetyltransferase, partial [Bacillales bacterium]|nr:GNAT family N-acetyltransferase [Bacillales bacterium]